jgi:uncharacterized protein YdcH (DUF465 family)
MTANPPEPPPSRPDPRRRETRWGLLVVIATLGLVAGLLTLAPLSGSRPPAATGASPTTTAAQQAADREQLLSVVPPEIRDSCFSYDERSFDEYLISVRCSSNDAHFIRLALFPDHNAMDTVYNEAFSNSEVPTDSGIDNCRKNKPGEGPWSWAGESLIAGRLLCYLDNNRNGWIHWTYDEKNIYAYASRSNVDRRALQSLYKLWLDFDLP